MAVTLVATGMTSEDVNDSTVDVTVSTLANEKLFAFGYHVALSGTRTHDSVVLDPGGGNETSLTQIGTLNTLSESGDHLGVSCWQLEAPPIVTSVPLRLALSANNFLKTIAFARVNGHLVETSVVTESGTVTNQTTTAVNNIDPVAADNLVLSALLKRSNFFTASIDNGTIQQELEQTRDIDQGYLLGSFPETDLSSHNFGWTNSGNFLISILSNVVVEAAAAAGGRIMSSLAGAGGLAANGGIAGSGGGLAG